MFGKRKRENVAYEKELHQWRRHKLLYELINRRMDEIILIDPDIARTLRRDGYVTEEEYPEAWKVTPRGVAANARWGVDGPGAFRYPS